MAIIRKEGGKCTICVILFLFFFLVEVGEKGGGKREGETTKTILYANVR